MVANSDHTQTCALTGFRLITSGHEDLGADILGKIARQACEDSRFYEWYTPDHCPQGSDQCRATASVFLRGAQELKKRVGVQTPHEPMFKETHTQSHHRHGDRAQPGASRDGGAGFRPRGGPRRPDQPVRGFAQPGAEWRAASGALRSVSAPQDRSG